MQRPDLATLACVNADCHYYGQPGQGNLTIRKVYGQDGIRLLRCSKCQEEFSERRKTALFNTKVSEAKAEAIIDHLDEGCSIRGTSRLTKSAKATVARLLKTSGRHAQRFHHQEVQDLRPRAIEFDEQWSYVKKKQKNCAPEESHQAGDFWDHTAITPDSKLIVSLVVGKRTKDQTQELVSDTQSRLHKGHLPVLFSDGYEGYEPSILESFGHRYQAPQSGSTGRPSLDIVRWPQSLAYGQIIKSTKEKLSDGIHLKVVRGKAKLLHTLSLLGYDKINTSSIERHNGTSRLHNQRKVRKTLAFSKSHLYHGWMSWLSVMQYNFCRAHGSLRMKDESGPAGAFEQGITVLNNSLFHRLL
jgi:IS1 family transposase/transposase-like protein